MDSHQKQGSGTSDQLLVALQVTKQVHSFISYVLSDLLSYWFLTKQWFYAEYLTNDLSGSTVSSSIFT